MRRFVRVRTDIMASTRRIRVLLDPFGEICRHTAASMLHECAINSHVECWKYCHLTNILLLGYKEVRSQDTHSDEVWAPGESLIKCYHR